MEAIDDLQSQPLPKTTKVICSTSAILFLLATVLNGASVALFCVQKLSGYLAIHLISTSALVWKTAIWSTVASAIGTAAQAYLVSRQFRLHIESVASQRTQPTPVVPPLINFTETSPSYEYETLGTGCVRILELLPSDDSQPISCRLHQANLESLPKYEAFSYTWGTEKSDCIISISGKRFIVRPNLYCALRVFRPSRTAESRWVWIDALCINQDDLSEREEQVLKMDLNYSNSWRLLIWLGSEADDSAWAIAAITELTKSTNESEAAIRAWEEVFLSDQSFRRTLSAVTALVNRSWFRRSWIVQEYALSYDKTRIFYCGDKHFKPADFRIESTTRNLFWKIKGQLDFNANKFIAALRDRQAPQFLQDLSSFLPSSLEFLEDMVNEALRMNQASRLLLINEEASDTLNDGIAQLLRVLLMSQSYETEVRKWESSADVPDCNSPSRETKTARKNPLPFLQYTLVRQLPLLRGMEATDPRDKVYSLLGLFQNPNRDFCVNSHDRNLLIIKYSESVANVYASLVRAIVVPTRRLEIFQECHGKRTNDLPSWVPDWSSNYLSNFGGTNYRYGASSETYAQFSFLDDLSVMTVKGFV